MHDKWNCKWKVTGFGENHNHQLVTPCKRIKMMSNRNMPKAVKDLTEALHKENIEISKVPSIFGGEYIGFDNRDCFNHLRNVRHRDLDCGDAQSVLNYFKTKQAHNPQFFYAIQCDESGRAINFFWVDSLSCMAYQYFGDVVTFDTTYRINKYDMPFAPFTGVNHHMQSIQYGCALLQDETEVTFVWLFQTWLDAMGGRPPTSIITNQDLGMKEAIAKVFPNTRHHLCLWHIKKKFIEELPQVYYKRSKFKKDMKKCIKGTFKKDDFEERWMLLMKETGLESNKWLQGLFDIRESWVPVYNCGTFFAGMNTTEHNEGINSFFDGFVAHTSNLKEVVVKYEKALKMIVKRENNEDFESEHKFRIVNDHEFLLKHAAKVYTRNVFNKFKDEWSKVFYYKVENVRSANGFQSFVVKSKDDELEKFEVTLDSQTYEGKCECQQFEFVGILCAHILKVFVRLDIDEIPKHFILPRWRQKANKFRIIDSLGLVHDDGKEESKALRLGHMCHKATKLACLAAPSNEAYTIFIEGINVLFEKIQKVSMVSPIEGCQGKSRYYIVRKIEKRY
ncbi:protein FAR1-RELATED SEQUENCE 5-like [Rhododendron vialii]|uniref:protein FAR1-RELATED SEQUENCE 5-like n=1 Tax=Rhododendron vialii TaxID=182163 RepID=UPI0026602518|nr:protein FAR1-RELATED SEQUENCE 5-like [Rhododendron vialii]